MTPKDRAISRIASLAHPYDEADVVARDMMADLMHWCEARGLDFDDELRIATANYTAETLEDIKIPDAPLTDLQKMATALQKMASANQKRQE